MRKRKKKLLITLCVIGALFGVPKIYYAVGNDKYNNKIKELKDNGQMNFQIDSKKVNKK
jgi:hypothetical protein